MEAARFDRIVQHLHLTGSATRRTVVGLLAALAASGVGEVGTAAAAATCRNPGKPCQRGGQCCSGRCAGKKGKKRCKAAPNQDICTIARDACLTSEEVPCATTGNFDCQCLRTTAGLSFCANKVIVASPRVLGCDGDASCAETFGEGTRCIRPGSDCGELPFCAQPCPSLP